MDQILRCRRTRFLTYEPSWEVKNQHELYTSIDPPEGGSTTLATAGGIYDEGTEVTVNAKPAEGYKFDNWSGDIFGTSKTKTVTMNSDMNVTANFTKTGGGEEPSAED